MYRPRIRSKVCAFVLIFVLGWPLCGTQGSEDSQPAWGEILRHHKHAGESGLVDAPAIHEQLRRFLTADNDAQITQSLGSARHGSDEYSHPNRKHKFVSKVRKRSRSLPSGALRMLSNLAELVTQHGGRSAKQRGTTLDEGVDVNGWVQNYVCMLHRVEEGLRAERVRAEEFEDRERDKNSDCRKALLKIQRNLKSVVQENAAIDQRLYMLQVWKRKGLERGEQSLATATNKTKQAGVRNDMNRLKAQRKQNEAKIRSIQAQQKSARIRCGLLEWTEHQKDGASTRLSKLLAQAEANIDDLRKDAPALTNISRSIALNLTLPACSSSNWSMTGLRRSVNKQLRSDSITDSLWDDLSVLQRSWQQASHDVFLELTELVTNCKDLQSSIRADTDALLHEDIDFVKTRGEIDHLARIVDTLQKELVALHGAKVQAQEQASRLQTAIGSAKLPSHQREVCLAAIDRLQQQQDSVQAQIAGKSQEVLVPQNELTRLRALLDGAEKSEMQTRRHIEADRIRQKRCSQGLRWLRTSAGLVSRHSSILSHLVDYRMQVEIGSDLHDILKT